MRRYQDPLLKDTLYQARLENGLEVVTLHKPEFKQATARVGIKFGSIDSCFKHPETGQVVELPDGIAHFLEHKLFEDEDGNVSDRFSELGAESNAYTTFSHTVYYFNTTNNFEACLDLLLEFVQNPWFTDESVAKEQGIIEQEIRMYLDDPGWRSSANLLEALYVNHPVRIDIAGTVQSIRQIDKETLYLCHRTFYHPSNMIVFVAGDVDPERVLAQVQASFDRHSYPSQAAIERILPGEPAEIATTLRKQQLVVNQPILRLGFKDREVGLTGRALLEQDLLTAMIMDAICGRGSQMYTQMYESGLIDQRFGFEYSVEESYGYSYFAGPTRDPEALKAALLDGIASAREAGLSEDDFRRAQKKTIGRIISFMNDLDSIAYVYMDGSLKDVRFFDLIPAAQSLSLEAANHRLREHFDPVRAAVSLIEPK